MVPAMFAQHLPGGLSIAPDPLDKHLIAHRCPPVQLPAKAFQPLFGQALLPGDAGRGTFRMHHICILIPYTSIFLRTSTTAM